MKKIAKKIKKVYEAKRDICALSDLFALNIDDKNAEINSYVRSESAKLVRDGISADKAFELNKKTYLLTARDNFDDFMTYIEWNREPNARYWQPRRKQLLPVCNALQRLEDDELDELFISMPPRVGKTTLVVFFLLWIMLRGPERSNLYCSYSDTVVGVFYTALTEILNDPMTYLWLDVFPERKLASTDAKNNLLNIDRKKHYASFTGRSLYGTLNGACDCNGYEIADDLHSGIEEAMSKDRLNAAWMKVDNNYLPRGKEKTKHLWIGTRWSQVDAIARRIDLLENDGKYKSVRYEVINLPALNENDESNFRYLYELGFSTEHYQQRRASFERNNDMASWFAQFMGEPIERDGTVFNPDELRYYNGVLPEGDPDRIFMAVDPAWGGGDFVAAPVCVQYGNDLYVTDVVYDNGDKRITQPLVMDTAKKHNDIKPGVVGLANALGVDRHTLACWKTEVRRGLNFERVALIKKAYRLIEEGWEIAVNEAKGNPANLIFLGKNHFGYVDEVKITASPVQPLGENLTAEEAAKKYQAALPNADFDGE